MGTERMGSGGEALFEVRLERASGAPPEAVYDLLAGLQHHLEWGGRLQKKGFRLTALEGPAGSATVGTEFRTTGIDPSGSFTDGSVVTEATRPEVFEFVTEARLRPKRGPVLAWTNVHRYVIRTAATGCTVSYSIRVMRLSRRPWWTKRWARGLAQKMSASYAKVGLDNLVRMAEERAGLRSAA